MKRAVLVVLLLLGVGGAGLVGLSAWLRSRARATWAQNARDLERDWATLAPRIHADHARWAADPLFAPHGGPDASPLLNRHVPWPDRAAPEPLPAEWRARLTSWGHTWADHVDDAQALATVDLGWMAGLPTFGVWDLEAPGGPLEHRPFEALTEPTPEWDALTGWVQLRLLQGLVIGQPGAAATEVRALARLLLTTERFMGEAMALKVLALERSAWLAAQDRGLAVTGWTPLTEDDVRSLSRALWAAKAPWSLQADLSEASIRVGRCAAIREGTGTALLLRQYLTRLLPEAYARAAQSLATPGCRLRRLKAAWAQSGEGELLVERTALCAAGLAPCDAPALTLSLPFMKGTVGLELLTTVSVDWLRPYR